MSTNPPSAAIPRKFTPASLIGITEEDTFTVSLEESIRQVNSKLKIHLHDLLANVSTLGVVCVNNPITARLQQGPTCGLVSLRMSAEAIIERSHSLPVASKEVTLLEMARSKGYSGFGEMFNAFEMTSLAEEYFGAQLSAETWDAPWDLPLIQTLLKTLLSSGMALVPYDVDKNHEPCLAGGKKAHWAAIKGFILPITTPLQLKTMEQLTLVDLSTQKIPIVEGGTPLFWVEPSKMVNANELQPILSDGLSIPQLRIITQQSKSKHQAIWTFEALQKSNHNLTQFDEERVTSSDFKVPDVLDNLRGKMVFLQAAPKEA